MICSYEIRGSDLSATPYSTLSLIFIILLDCIDKL